jgi:hypothetical protein
VVWRPETGEMEYDQTDLVTEFSLGGLDRWSVRTVSV